MLNNFNILIAKINVLNLPLEWYPSTRNRKYWDPKESEWEWSEKVGEDEFREASLKGLVDHYKDFVVYSGWKWRVLS